MILVFGSFNADYVWRTPQLPAPGETRLGEFSAVPGGKGFNQAIAAHRLGAETHFVGGLGVDAGATMARAVARDDGLPASFIECTVPTGTACVVVDAAGRNQIVVAPGANLAVTADQVLHRQELWVGTRVLLCQFENDPGTTLAVLQAGQSLGALTLLNPAPAPSLLPEGMLAAVAILTPNESEFRQLLQLQCGADPGAEFVNLTDLELHQWCRRLGVPTVVVTLGAAGAFVSHGADRRGDAVDCYRIASLKVDAVDTTGAGDCFNGALAAALLLRPQIPFADHVRFACAAAALSTLKPGAATAMPTAIELAAARTET